MHRELLLAHPKLIITTIYCAPQSS